MVVNIDVKQGGDELIEEIDKLITAHKREKSTIWGSFKEESSLKCYYQASFRNNGSTFIIYVSNERNLTQNPEVGRYFSLTGVVKLYLFFFTGLLPFISLKETHLEIPLYSSKETSHLTRRQQFILRLAKFLIIRPALFRHLNKRGIPVM